MTPEERAPLPLPAPAPLTPPEGFAERLAAIGLTLDAAVVAKLGDYLARLLAMNELMNLTSVTDPVEVWEKHVLDSLTLVPLLDELSAGARIADIGSGGGLPGIPLAMARPDLKVTLVEATQKKASFLVAVAAGLGLTNVSVRAERAEQLGKGDLRGAFDAVTARAVGRLVMLIPLTVPFVRPNGMVLLVKGQRAEEELAEASWVLGRQRAAFVKTVGTPTGKIVVLQKSGEEPKRNFGR
ncbi:16S rRNA (guanine(527)-N(7))-methyltransferase RsmG [Sorangium sp. So ce1182]|uniref:16S rRNA (guanine(527)-N(7))-methyltransferase RsmG n=1 Tax=Sorangium sp. So ce1182 TaxID=3133334 RepID=UPI003F6465B2